MITAFFKSLIMFACMMFVFGGIASADEPNYYNVECYVKAKKNIIKEEKPITLKLFCASKDGQLPTILLPEQFFTHQRVFAQSLRFINEHDQELCLMDRRYSRDDRLYRYVPHPSGDEVMELRFPEKRNERFRVVNCKSVLSLEHHEIMKMENLYSVGRTFLPKGEYKIYLMLPEQWQTARVGHHNLILTQNDNKKTNVGNYDWWVMSKSRRSDQLTVK